MSSEVAVDMAFFAGSMPDSANQLTAARSITAEKHFMTVTAVSDWAYGHSLSIDGIKAGFVRISMSISYRLVSNAV